MKDKRRGATPYYRDNAEKDYMLLIGLTFIVGAMMGAVLALGFLL